MILIAVIALLVQAPQLPSFAEVRDLFEAGKYQETIDAARRYREGAGEADINLAEDATWPRLLFLAAESHRKMQQTEAAINDYAELAARPETSAWRYIGHSAKCLLDKQCMPPEQPPAGEEQAERPLDPLQAAQRAVEISPDLPEAAYQLGMARTFKGDFAGGAEAFDKASELDREFAYAYYNAGLCHYKAKRVDLMASRFQSFLKLAPEAPERSEVMSIMRTLRR